MNEKLKCFILAVSVDMILIGCTLIMLSLAHKSITAFVIIGIFGLIYCTYRAVKEYRKRVN